MTDETLQCLADSMEGVSETVVRGFGIDLLRYENTTAEKAVTLFSWLLRTPEELKHAQARMEQANNSKLQSILARK